MPPKKPADEELEAAAPEEPTSPADKYELPVDVVAQDPRSLKYLLEAPELPIVLASVKALCKYADESAEHRVELATIGCISALMPLLANKSLELQVAVTEVLERIAKEEINRPELTERGTLAAFLDMLVGKNLELKSVAATAMDDCISRHDLAELGCVPVLVNMLPLSIDETTPEEDEGLDLMKIRSADSLAKLCSELTLRPLMRTCPEMKDFGAVGPLSHLHESSSTPQVRVSCAGALSNLALDAQSRLDMLQCFGPATDHTLYGIVKPLVLRSHDGDRAETLPCVQALARVTAQPIGCDAVIEAGMLGHIAQMLTAERIDASVECRKQSVHASTRVANPEIEIDTLTLHSAVTIVANCLTRPLPANNDNVRLKFAQCDPSGLERMIELVKTEGMMAHPEVLSTTLYAVMQLAETAPCRHQTIELALVSEMPRLFASESVDVKTSAAYVMATLAYDISGRDQMVEFKVVEAVMSLLEDPAPQVLAAALFCVTNAVRANMIRNTVVDEMGLGRHLVRILDGSDADVLKNALRCTCAISADSKNAVQLCFDGVIQKAEYHQTSQSKAVQKYAAETLKRITDGNLPAKLWSKKMLSETDRCSGVFYDVGKMDKFEPLAELQARPPNNYQAEVLVWDLETDPRAARWVEEAQQGVEQCMPEILEQVGWIARYVAKEFGGAMPPEDYFNKFDVAKFMRKEKRNSNSQCVKLGYITRGGTRHRALLLKFLCDYCDVDCSLERGPFGRGAHAFHSWNVVTTENKERLVVDLVFAPGAVYVEGSEEARQYQCRDEYAFSSLCTK